MEDHEEDIDWGDDEEEDVDENTNNGSKKKKIVDDEDPYYEENADESENEDDELEEDDDEDEIEKDEEIFGETGFKTSTSLDKSKKEQHFAEFSEDEDEYDEEDEDYEKYLQKFDESISKNIIADWHPELQNCNYDEIDILSRVVRDQHGVIIDPLHQTIPFITRYEKARVLGERAKQINSGAKPLVDVDENVIDGYLIALKEFEEKKIPFIIKRPLPNGGCEYWKCKDLEFI